MAEILPEYFKVLFWDTDFTKIRQAKHKFCIIERSLKLGRPEHIRWILDNYSRREIVSVVKKSSNLDRKTANYWALHYKIPKKAIKCLNRQLMDSLFA